MRLIYVNEGCILFSVFLRGERGTLYNYYVREGNVFCSNYTLGEEGYVEKQKV